MCQGITEHMDGSVLYSWILKCRAPRSLQGRGQIVWVGSAGAPKGLQQILEKNDKV